MAYKKYNRPQVNLDPVSKTWETRQVSDIKVGCVIPDFGEVLEIESDGKFSNTRWWLKFVNGSTHYFADGAVYCFQ